MELHHLGTIWLIFGIVIPTELSQTEKQPSGSMKRTAEPAKHEKLPRLGICQSPFEIAILAHTGTTLPDRET